MERVYKILYQLNVKHTFYKSGLSNDFSMKPIGDTAKKLKSNGLIFRGDSTGFNLVYRTNGGGNNAFFELEEKEKFVFGFSLKNELAAYYTVFPEKTEPTDIYIHQGSQADAAMQLVAMATREPRFTEYYTKSFEKMKFKILDQEGNMVYEEVQNGKQDEIVPSNYQFSFSLNLGTDFPMGVYKLQLLKDGVVNEESEVYIFSRLQYPNLIGVFELTLENTIDYEDAPFKANLEFEPTSSNWIYHIELTRNFENGAFSITNADSGSAVSFSETSALPDYLKGETAIFESSEPIPKNEVPNLNFSLEVTSDDIDLNLNNLPNPSHHSSKSIIYLKI